MSLLDWMQPRDHRVAGRTVSALLAVAVVLSLATAPVAPRTTDVSPAFGLGLGVAVLVVILLSWWSRRFDEGTRLAWTLCPLAGVALLVVIDLLTRDASVVGQVYFLFPAVYGAALLPRWGACVMLVASLTGELIVLASLAPWRTGVTEFVNVAAVLTTVVVLLVRSSERQAALMEELTQLAAIDSLTGLVTRRVLNESATAALSGARSDEGTSLILLDVDGFKSVNDTYGHPVGDEVLVSLAQLVLQGSRRSDVVCRLGGDELAVLMPGCPVDVAEKRARAIVTDVRSHAFGAGEAGTIGVSVSVGVAHAPTHAGDLRSLYAAADGALYEAKRAGRDQVVTQTRRAPTGLWAAARQGIGTGPVEIHRTRPLG